MAGYWLASDDASHHENVIYSKPDGRHVKSVLLLLLLHNAVRKPTGVSGIWPSGIERCQSSNTVTPTRQKQKKRTRGSPGDFIRKNIGKRNSSQEKLLNFP